MSVRSSHLRHLPADRLPRLALGHFPTPVERHLLDIDGAAVPILIKRDDLCSDRYAGNKVRKLEYLLADARARGATRLVTAGAAGSHHALATTVHGTANGFDVSLVLFPQQRTRHVRDVLLMDHALGAELRFTPSMVRVPFALWRARLAHRRERVCMIPPGGSNAVGTLGYVGAGLEFAEQIRSGSADAPSAIYVAAGTLGTVAGLALGLAIAGVPIPIVAVRITATVVTNERVLRGLVAGAAKLLVAAGVEVPPLADALQLVTLRHDQIGTGYGHATAAGDAAAAAFAALGLTLDATYTAKAAAALVADCAAAPDPGTDSALPLFWHTLSAAEPLDLIDDARVDALPAPFADYLQR